MLPYHQVTKDFLKGVIQENKKLLRMSEVKFVNVPAFDEIAVKHLYSAVLKKEGMAAYFPDKFPKNTQCEKAYFYNVWNTLYPEQVKEVIKHANEQRYTVSNQAAQENSIAISEGWQRELDSMPFISKQRGRMTFLLKQKSAIRVERKPKITYEVHESLKRPRVAQDLNLSQVQPQASAPSQTQYTPKGTKKITPTILEHGDTQMKDGK